MDTVCPSCNADITPDDVNVGENVAYCRACDTVHRLSELAERERVPSLQSGDPPAGAWVRDDGYSVRLGATARSIPTAGFFIVFSGFWNSIVGVFVFQSIGSLLGFKGAGSSPGGSDVFTLVFMIPFVLVGLGTAGVALMALFGRVEVTIRGMDARAFTGIGPLGWSRRFDASSVKDVTIERANSSTNGKPDRHIVVDAGDRTVKLGSVLSRARRRWLAGALGRLLLPSR